MDCAIVVVGVEGGYFRSNRAVSDTMTAVALPPTADRRAAASRNPRVGQATVTTLGRVVSAPERRYFASVRLARVSRSDRVATPVAATGRTSGRRRRARMAPAWPAGGGGQDVVRPDQASPSKAARRARAVGSAPAPAG